MNDERDDDEKRFNETLKRMLDTPPKPKIREDKIREDEQDQGRRAKPEG